MPGASGSGRLYGGSSSSTPIDAKDDSDYWGLHPGPAAEPAAPAGRSSPDDRRPGFRDTGKEGGTRAAAIVSRTRRRDPIWAKLCLIFGASLMMISGGVIVTAKVIMEEATGGLTQTSLIEGDAMVAAGPDGSTINGPINLLLVGIDVRAKDGSTKGARADTIVIVHIPKTHDQAYLVSIPRDLRVDIPAYPKTGFRGRTDKINAAFNEGYEGDGDELQKRARGVDLVAKTINKATGIKFNGAAIIDFVGFEAVVRELDGVNMCVDQRAESIHLATDRSGKIVPTWFDEASERVRGVPAGGRRIVHEIGCRRMSPELALDYARIRYGLPNTDYDRQRHQQQLLKAIAKEATSKGVITDLGKLRRVVDAAGKAFVLDTGGVKLKDFLFTLKSVAANDLVMVKTNKGTFNGAKIGNVSYENLSPESLRMLHAVRDGKLYEFILAHPDWQSIE